MTRPADTAYTDQLAAAVDHTGRTLDALGPVLGGTKVPHRGIPAWVMDLAARVNAVTTVRACQHFTGGPQPVNVLAWAPDVRLCTACARNNYVLAAFLPGTTAAAQIRADETCDGCQQHRPDQVAQSVIQPNGTPFLIWCGLCDTCRKDMADA